MSKEEQLQIRHEENAVVRRRVATARGLRRASVTQPFFSIAKRLRDARSPQTARVRLALSDCTG